MKNWCKSIILFLSVGAGQSAFGLGPLFPFFDTQWEVTQSFTQTVEKSIEELKTRKKTTQEALSRYKVALEDVQKMLAAGKGMMPRLRGTEQDYATQQQTTLNSMNQVLAELVQVTQEIDEIRGAHIKALEDYKNDPEFRAKGYQFEQKSIYAIEDYQKVTTDVLRYGAELQGIKERLEKLATDLETLKKNFELAQQALTDKRHEQAELKEQKLEPRLEHRKFTLKQRGTLLDLEERLLTYKRDLAEALLGKADAQLQFLEFQSKITTLQLDFLQRYEDQVRRELRIDHKDVQAAEKALKAQIQEANRLQEEYNHRIENLTAFRQSELEKLTLAKQRASLSDMQLEKIYAWTVKPYSVAEWNTLLTFGRANNALVYDLDVMRDLLHAKIDQEKAKVIDYEVDSLVIASWENLTSGSFDGSSDALSREIKNYQKVQTDLESSLASLNDKRDAASRLLANNSRIIEAIKERIKDLKEQRETIFKQDTPQFNRLGKLLSDEAFIDEQKRGEQITQLIELYSSIIQQRTQTSQKIEMMVRALTSKDRSKLVLPLWNGIKKFIPDTAHFVSFMIKPGQLQESILRVQTEAQNWINGLAFQPLAYLLLCIFIIGLFGLYAVLRRYLYDLGVFIARLVPADYGLVHLLAAFLAVIIQFLSVHLLGIFLWGIAYGLVWYGFFDAYLSALFYSVSLFVWLYYAGCFIRYARSINQNREYQFTSKKYHDRFFTILSTLLSATCILFFFSAALGRVIPHSDVPRILQAINFIIFQVSLIFMISREQILRLIPHHTDAGKLVLELVETYYYLFLAALIFIIVMSNPFIGYGPTFLYVFFRIVLIALLIPVIVMIHTKIKSIVGSVFFMSDDEGRLTERFPYARTSYGLVIIGSFIFFSFLMILIALNIWGFSVGIRDVSSLMRKDLYGYVSPDTGRRVAVNALHLFRVLLYLAGGIAVAFVINRFILRRMFDLLLVKSGVQTIFLSLTRYVIVLVALVIGLQSVGLGNWLLYTLAVLGGIAVANKEIIADFIGYFLILIQRPLKIGDYVSISPELIGVVRHITLRSVILRRKNSVTVIVPNSYILSRPLTNWNYYRTYFAFEDIILTVSYKTDPHKIRELFLQVLDENTDVLRNPAPIVRLDGFTDIGFQFMIRGYLSHEKVSDQSDIASDIRLELVRILRQHGYDVAVPTRILKVEKDSGSFEIDQGESFEE